MDSKPTYSAPALDKGLDILEILAKTVMPMTMSEISDKAGRSRGEIFRMLQVLELRSDIDHEQACGATPVSGLTLTARRKGLKPELVDLRNSGDTAGDKSRVVGYASFAFYE